MPVSGDEATVEKKRERNTFLFLTVVLAPVITIFLVGSYAFLIWMVQIIAGPPGPPS